MGINGWRPFSMSWGQFRPIPVESPSVAPIYPLIGGEIVFPLFYLLAGDLFIRSAIVSTGPSRWVYSPRLDTPAPTAPLVHPETVTNCA